ncbi:hypothetical protein [Kushneria phosphatilytica]|uniref:hypothetical protein n=1 Tax=Kushneria phosphatilytica TaxID=657387 RepID=UPI00143BA59D|nr:hypothetical protein [Kushneria phosphatilytica]
MIGLWSSLADISPLLALLPFAFLSLVAMEWLDREEDSERPPTAALDSTHLQD